MFAHPNNEGIWRKETALLLVGVEGHQQPENTRVEDAGYTRADTLQWTQTRTQAGEQTHTHPNTDKKINKKITQNNQPHKNTNSNLFTLCLLAQKHAHMPAASCQYYQSEWG